MVEQLLQQLLLLCHGKEDEPRVRGQLLAEILDAVRQLVDRLDALSYGQRTAAVRGGQTSSRVR